MTASLQRGMCWPTDPSVVRGISCDRKSRCPADHDDQSIAVPTAITAQWTTAEPQANRLNGLHLSMGHRPEGIGWTSSEG
jgi:hypothetical protein